MNKIINSVFNGNNQDIRELIMKSGSTFFIKIFSLVLGYLLILLITKSFDADVFGRYSITITLSQLFVMVFTLGLPNAIVKITADTNFESNLRFSNYMLKSLRLAFVVGLIVSVVFYLSSDYIASMVFNDKKLAPYFKVLSFAVLPMMFHELLTNFFRGKKHYTKYNILTFILPYALFFVIFFMLNQHYGQEVVTFASFALAIFMVLSIELILFKKLKLTFKTNFKTRALVQLSFPMMFSTTLLFLLTWTDLFMLGFLKSAGEVGVYNTAFKISSLGYLVILAINVVIAPKISELYGSKKFGNLKSIIQHSTRLIAILTIPLVLGILIFRKTILAYFGPEFVEGHTAMVIISAGVLVNALSGNVDQILNMTNSQNLLRNITIFCFICNVILNLIFIPFYGINGAAMTSLATNVILNALCLYYIKKKLGYLTFY